MTKIEIMLVHAHSGLRWLVLGLLIYAIYNAFANTRSYEKKNKMTKANGSKTNENIAKDFDNLLYFDLGVLGVYINSNSEFKLLGITD